jgi:Uma2 family endonuclease
MSKNGVTLGCIEFAALTVKGVGASMDDVLATVEVRRRRFTVEEYYRMAEAGILGPEDRVELIEGEIVEMAPIGHRHAACVAELNRRLVPAVGDRALLWPQNPVRLPRDTEPQPDIVLLRPRADRYTQDSARPADVLLLIEVADTSYRYDRRVKLPLYARAGVPELWIVDLPHDAVEVYRRPGPQGYAFSDRVTLGGRVAPEALPDVILTVDDAFLAR